MYHLKIENVSKTYGTKKALDNVTIEFGEGITGLLGPNGAGKSTLMRIVAAIEKNDTGAVLYNGYTAQTQCVAEQARLSSAGFWSVSEHDGTSVFGIHRSDEKPAVKTDTQTDRRITGTSASWGCKKTTARRFFRWYEATGRHRSSAAE